MLALTVWVALCFATSTVMAASHLDKPYYDLNDAENIFRNFIKEHGKEYEGAEYSERLEIFKENLKDINRRNEKYPLTVFEVNRLADLKPEERHNIHFPSFQRHFNNLNENTKKVTIPDGPNTAPKSFDWRTHGKVSHVKNLGKCFCSYIFSAIGNIEGQYAMKYNQSLALSEGQALDCCFDNEGCDGGSALNLMKDFARKPGLMLESDYPYVDGRRYCKENNTKVAVGVIDGIMLDTVDEEVLKQKLYEIGPLSVCISDVDFDFYKEGILEPDTCLDKSSFGCEVLVGYGEENGTEYWTMKFANGPEWGEKGYGRMRRGVNACGIGYETYTATVA